MVTFNDVLRAEKRIRKYIYTTPLELSPWLSMNGAKVYLKLECQQRLKSFKLRGAMSKLTSLSKEQREKGILAVSSGNHGAAVSYAAGALGEIKAKVFVPENAPQSKVEKIRYYGAEVIQSGESYDETHRIAMEALEGERLTPIDPCSDIEVIAGQGTAALEILEQNSEIDTIIAPVGGGGLITGLSVAAKGIKQSVRVIGVHTSACPAMIHALRDRVFYEEYPSGPSICDAVIGGVGEIPYKMAPEWIDQLVEVDEEYVKRAVPGLLIRDKVVAEPSGALGAAAILGGVLDLSGKNVAVVISGGNLDAELLKELLITQKG